MQTVEGLESAPVLAPTVSSNRLIAIRRYSAADAADPAENLAVLADPATQQDEHSRLQEAGLQVAVSLSSEERKEGVPAYVSLPLAQCLVLEASDTSNLLAAQDALTEDYILMPDIPLALPGPDTAGADASEEPFAALDATAGKNVLELAGLTGAAARKQQGKGAVIAVLDSGCDADHSEFAKRNVNFAWVPLALGAKVREVRGFDTAGHGTHVCGIAAGSTVGLAPQADLLVAAVIESERTVTSLDRILRGLNWILRRVTSDDLRSRPVILNLSLGFKREWLTPADLQTAMLGVRQALLLLTQSFKVLPVVAVGNDGARSVRAPGYFPEVLSVGAVDAQLEPATFSGGGHGPPPFESNLTPDVAGFGVDVASALERDTSGESLFGVKSGTSMATPYAVGVAALVGAETGLKGTELRSHLEDHIEPLAHPPDRVGKGLVRFAL